MLFEEVSLCMNLIKNDKTIRNITIFTVLFSLGAGFVLGPFAALVIFLSFVSGHLTCWLVIRYRQQTSLSLQRLVSFYRGYVGSKTKLQHSCSVCDNLTCKRFQKGRNISPWKHLTVPEELNSRIEKFYDRILKTFVASWYEEFTEDKDFLFELRYCLRYATCSVIQSFSELNLAKTISNRALPCFVKHLSDYKYMQQIAKIKNVEVSKVMVDYLGKRLHIAATNRNNELNYLRQVSASLLSFILPEQYTKCNNYSILIREIISGWIFLPLMDVLSDPNTINSLIISLASYENKKWLSRPCTKNVELLEGFEKREDTNKSLLYVDLNTVKRDTGLFYVFMQYLKKEQHVHLFQFCLEVDEFNSLLLTPELSNNELEELYSNAVKIYNEYLDEKSMNFINCSSNIAIEFSALLKDGVYNIAKLRNSTPLFKAYDYVCKVLEENWLRKFIRSEEYYKHLCGVPLSPAYNKPACKNKKNSSPSHSHVFKLSSGIGKLKGALKSSQPIEGAIYVDYQSVENEPVDYILPDCGKLFRDLSTWDISINSSDSLNKIHYFRVQVNRSDLVTEEEKTNWTVLRKDQDFYTLKAKLVEFHGENEICDSPLPTRRAGSVIETRMAKYEEFLKKLLQKSALRGSDLLYTFLTTEEDFTMFVSTCGTNSQDLGNIYQSVAHKLRKERGQHLDSFMTTFLNSTSNKPANLDIVEAGDEVESVLSFDITTHVEPKTFNNSVFGNNFGVENRIVKESHSNFSEPVGILESVFYLFKHIFKVPLPLLKLYVALCNIAHRAVESLCSMFIDHKINSSFCQSNLGSLIKLLENVIFEHYEPHSEEELRLRQLKALNDLKNVFSPAVFSIMGPEFLVGAEDILKILQHAHYNKHLMYHLLDVTLVEMYPDLSKNI